MAHLFRFDPRSRGFADWGPWAAFPDTGSPTLGAMDRRPPMASCSSARPTTFHLFITTHP